MLHKDARHQGSGGSPVLFVRGYKGHFHALLTEETHFLRNNRVRACCLQSRRTASEPKYLRCTEAVEQ
jgi:hypothetical protein